MSTTKEQMQENCYIEQEVDKQPKKPARVNQGHYDERYIELYCENPKAGKKAALIGAGYVGEYAAQEAARIHKRLNERIKQRLDDMFNELDALSFHNLKTILEKTPEEIGYSNALAAIKCGAEYAGRKPGETVTIKHESMEDIDKALEQTQREIEQLTGVQRTH